MSKRHRFGRRCSEAFMSKNSVKKIRSTNKSSINNRFLIFVDPNSELIGALEAALSGENNKIIIFGDFPPQLFSQFDGEAVSVTRKADLCDCQPAWSSTPSLSSGVIKYGQNVFHDGWERSFCRFDYGDEWNNHGYGRVLENSIWGIGELVKFKSENELAGIYLGEEMISSFMMKAKSKFGSLLWVNRAVGVIDGPDWRIIEDYISGEKHDELPCVPVVSEIPFGYKRAATMRLDCDESIKSADQLIAFYFNNKRPISLAISTDVLNRENSGDVVKRVYTNGGGVLSHSHSHPARWGSNYERALFEASHSATLINNVLGVPVVHMVAPFHHAPPFALKAIEEAGYVACIGGSATLDPEFVFARSGLPHGHDTLIGHNQQCMLHGDIFRLNGNSIAFFEEAFDLASASGSWFGYLTTLFLSDTVMAGRQKSSSFKFISGYLNFLKLAMI